MYVSESRFFSTESLEKVWAARLHEKEVLKCFECKKGFLAIPRAHSEKVFCSLLALKHANTVFYFKPKMERKDRKKAKCKGKDM